MQPALFEAQDELADYEFEALQLARKLGHTDGWETLDFSTQCTLINLAGRVKEGDLALEEVREALTELMEEGESFEKAVKGVPFRLVLKRI